MATKRQEGDVIGARWTFYPSNARPPLYTTNRSRNQDEWETIESACTALQSELKVRGLWEDKMLFVDDEYETGKVDTAPKVGWGETIASNFMWAASKIMGREPEPTLPTSVPVSSPGVHSTLGPAPPPKSQSPPAPQAVPAQRAEPENFRALASHSWKQAGIAAQGIGAAAAAVGGAIGHQVRDAVDNLGTSPTVPTKDEPSSSAPVPPAKPGAEVVPKDDKPAKVEKVETVKEVPAPEVKTATAETTEGKKETVAVTEDKAVEDISTSVAAVKLDKDDKAQVKPEAKEVKTETIEVVAPATTTEPATAAVAAETIADDADTPADDDEDTTEADTAETTEAEGAAEGASAPAAKKKNKKKGKKGKN